MSDTDIRTIKLQSVVLTREKQIILQEELDRYASATNWVIKMALKNHLSRPTRILEVVEEKFFEQFDRRPDYLTDVVKTAYSEMSRHRRLSRTIRSMRDKTPFFKRGRAIFSQPIVKVTDRAITLTLPDRTELPIPYDKYSRNKTTEEINSILMGERVKIDSEGKMPVNKRYDRIRLTWNSAGFLKIDIKANLPASDEIQR